MLYLFSGPRGLPGGLDEAASVHDLHVEYFDLEVSVLHDLCDDTFFGTVCNDLVNGSYDKGCWNLPRAARSAGCGLGRDQVIHLHSEVLPPPKSTG